MLYISRCQALKRPLRWSAKPLAQSIRRPLSQSSILFLRPTPCFRQEEPTPSLRDKVGPLENNDSFYNKVGKPGIRNQVIVSRVYFVISSPTCISKHSSRKFVVVGSFLLFNVAAVKTTTETENLKKKMVALSSVLSLKSITNTDLKRVQNSDLVRVSTFLKKIFFSPYFFSICCFEAIYKFFLCYQDT